MIPLLLTSLTFLVPVDAKPAEKQFRIECTCLHGDPIGSKEQGNVEVLFKHQFMLLNNQFGTYQFGASDLGFEFVLNLTPIYIAETGNLFVRFQPSFTVPGHSTGLETSFMLPNPDVARRVRIAAVSLYDQYWIEFKYVEVKEKQNVPVKKN
jgi:hypothetical protein